nr:hypothetical protein [Tanacetum cinerariifolium]
MACIEDIAKDAKFTKNEDQLLGLIRRQMETELMLEDKFRDLCEEVSNFVKVTEDVVKEVESLNCKDVATETVLLLRREQKRDLYKMTHLQMMVNKSYLSVREKHTFVSKMNLGTIGPYIPSTIIILAIPATNDSPEVPERTAVEIILNMSPKNKEHYQLKNEAIHFLLTGIGDEIYLTVDACKTTHDMRIAIERLQQGESLNIQDFKTNLFWEFGKFTSYDGESTESYYSRFYKMMNEMIRNNLTIATMQVNVQFL